MINLEIYRKKFNKEFPEYADEPYREIGKMIQGLPTINDCSRLLDSQCGNELLAFLMPLVKIKNYKSQVPFPVNVFDAIKCMAELKYSFVTNALEDPHKKIFDRLVEMNGFQLPTVSAVFHFCHPGLYPIVDKNIQAACKHLMQKYNDELVGCNQPKLPASTTSKENKLEKYREFITFLSRVRELHNQQYGTVYNYRDLDKALMVFGASKLAK